MTSPLNLDAYLSRIQWRGEIRHDLATLSGLLRAHMSTISFENLDILLGRPVHLDLASLQNKLVQNKRGGYCFEHGYLLAAALEGLGFKPSKHLARVVLTTPLAEASATHMFLTVPTNDQTYVLDPGFGGLAARAPVPLEDGASVTVDGARYSITRDEGWYRCRLDDGRRHVDLWAATLEAVNPIDFIVANHYTSTYPQSPFMQRLMLRTNLASGRVSVMNRHVTFVDEQPPRNVHLENRQELRRLLVEFFGFDLPDVERITVPLIPEWR